MLQAVAEEADQPHAGGDRRVPAAVDDAVQLLGVDPPEVLEGERVHRLVVLDEVLQPLDPHGVHLLGGVAVADVVLVEGQAEPLGPAVVPRLPPAGEAGDVVVLHPRGVPEQPGDGVSGAVGAVVGTLRVEVARDVDVQLTDASEGVGEQL